MRLWIATALLTVLPIKTWACASNTLATGQAKERAKAEFEKTDKNHDGFLNLQEFMDSKYEPSAPFFTPTDVFKKMDSNHDGKLSFEEKESYDPRRHYFDYRDKDGDGFWSIQEYARFDPPSSSDIGDFKKIDANGDQKIDFEEYINSLPVPSC